MLVCKTDRQTGACQTPDKRVPTLAQNCWIQAGTCESSTWEAVKTSVGQTPCLTPFRRDYAHDTCFTLAAMMPIPAHTRQRNDLSVGNNSTTRLLSRHRSGTAWHDTVETGRLYDQKLLLRQLARSRHCAPMSARWLPSPISCSPGHQPSYSEPASAVRPAASRPAAAVQTVSSGIGVSPRRGSVPGWGGIRLEPWVERSFAKFLAGRSSQLRPRHLYRHPSHSNKKTASLALTVQQAMAFPRTAGRLKMALLVLLPCAAILPAADTYELCGRSKDYYQPENSELATATV